LGVVVKEASNCPPRLLRTTPARRKVDAVVVVGVPVEDLERKRA